MSRLYKIFALLLTAACFFECQKDLSFFGGPDRGVFSNPINAILQGNITDENDGPAAGVTITVGNAKAVTNRAGYFRIRNASLDKNTTLAIAEKAGYFTSYRVFAATGGTNQISIKLVKKELTGKIPAGGGSVTLQNGAKVTLAENSIVNASSGAAYPGNVNVYASYIDPTGYDIAAKVPGSFVANDKNGKRVVLSSFGMLAVELTDDNGVKLQVKTGSVASLSIPIPSLLLSTAPPTIAMWSINEQTGLWQEDGTASKQGSNYVGDVKHFSFWNCDHPFDAVTLSLTLYDASKQPFTNAFVKLTIVSSDTGIYSSYGITDSLGEVRGYVPANKKLLLEVLDPCGKTVFSKAIPALAEDTDMGAITVSMASNTLLTFKGTLLNCNGVPVSNGYAIIEFSYLVHYAATDSLGRFTSNFIVCPGAQSTAQITGVDESSQQQSVANTISVTTPVTNVASIIACGTSNAQFVNYTLDNTAYYLIPNAQDSSTATTYLIGLNSNETYIDRHRVYDANNYTFTVDSVFGPGVYPIKSLSIHGLYASYIVRPFDVNFTTFPTVAGEFYEGSFEGSFRDEAANKIHAISFVFRLRRTF